MVPFHSQAKLVAMCALPVSVFLMIACRDSQSPAPAQAETTDASAEDDDEDSGDDFDDDTDEDAGDSVDEDEDDSGALDGGAEATTSNDDAATDSGAGQLSMTVLVPNLFESCKPPTPQADPVVLSGTVRVQNKGTNTVGPISLVGGAIYTTSGVKVATFNVKPSSLATLAPGATGTLTFDKVQPSLSPANGCSTLTCDAKYVVQVTLTAPGIPSLDGKADPIAISCGL